MQITSTCYGFVIAVVIMWATADRFKRLGGDRLYLKPIPKRDNLIPLTLFQTDRQPPLAYMLETWNKWNKTMALPASLHKLQHHSKTQPAKHEIVKLVFMDDDEGRSYLKTHWGARHVAAFDSLAIGAIKADFLRLCYIADEGGFYADSDLCSDTISLDVLRKTGAELIMPATFNWAGEQAVWNAFFAATPRHPAMLALVEKALQRIEQRYAEHGTVTSVMGIAGPNLMTPLLDVPKTLILQMDRRIQQAGQRKVGGGRACLLRDTTRSNQKGYGKPEDWLGCVVVQCKKHHQTSKNYWQKMVFNKSNPIYHSI